MTSIPENVSKVFPEDATPVGEDFVARIFVIGRFGRTAIFRKKSDGTYEFISLLHIDQWCLYSGDYVLFEGQCLGEQNE